ncbi:DUF2062 domain-containing protein [Akkermansiaceae bacterium]|jgi:uncharacterized protein (DUF2062 family)|nr:DUF2062 domain-containing protein [Akkermansiaceae bacterium]
MITTLKKRYLRLVRSAYRVLLSPRLRKRVWLQKIIAPMFDRELWHPCRETVSTGLAVGLFVSMLPIPGQMLLAAFGAVKLRANIPLSIAACWVTNPFTQVPIMIFQARFGTFLREHLGVEVPFGNITASLPGISQLQFDVGSFILGFLSLAFLLLLLTYPVVYVLSAILPKLIPKRRYQRARAKIIARRESNNQSS